MKYTNQICPVLEARLQAVLEDDRPRHLEDEIAIVEVMLQEAVAKFSHYVSLPTESVNEKKLRDGGVQLTTSYFLTILKDYRALLLDQRSLQAGGIGGMSSIEAGGPNIIAQTALHVEKVLVSYGQELGIDSRIAANEIAHAIGVKVLLPQGTDITPDQDVIEMDATIPYAGSDGSSVSTHSPNSNSNGYSNDSNGHTRNGTNGIA